MTKRIKRYPSGRVIKKLDKAGLKATGGTAGYATKRQSDYAFGKKDPDVDKRKFHDPRGRGQKKITGDIDKIIKKYDKAARPRGVNKSGVTSKKIRGGGGGGGFQMRDYAGSAAKRGLRRKKAF